MLRLKLQTRKKYGKVWPLTLDELLSWIDAGCLPEILRYKQHNLFSNL